MKRYLITGVILATALSATHPAKAQSIDLGNGFRDHGVATPISNHRGTVATVDGKGNAVALSWLMDHRGGYCLLMLDLSTGETRQFPTPWRGDSPFAAILSSANRYYTHCGNWFVEFDPSVPDITFQQQTAPRMAMSMTEDDNGVIWSATYPQSGVASYNPKTGEFRDYGHVYKQDWAQYPRAVAADDTGWIYLGIGNTAAQIVSLDPVSGTATPIIPEEQRGHGRAVLTRDTNGKVYGSYKDLWWELYQGKATRIDKPETLKRKSYIASSQNLFHRQAPNGVNLVSLDLVERQVTVQHPNEEAPRVLPFDYESEGAHLMGVAAASDGTACGGTAFPMRFFSYNPRSDSWVNRKAYGQWNTVAGTDSVFFVGGYTGGFLLEWDPAKPWQDTEKDNAESNPRFLAQAKPDINRPHDLLVYPDGQHVILSGTPGYGLTGGGLLIWDRASGQSTVLPHTKLIEWQSAMTLVPLPGGLVLAGTTTSPGTGGAKKADLAELYILDLESQSLTWHAPLLEGVQAYTEMMLGPEGLVFGFADRSRFFVFDPATRSIVHESVLPEALGKTTYSQGPRIFVQSPDGRIFVILSGGIAQLDPQSYAISLLAESPVPISPGGAWLDGRIYFGSGSHLYSWQVPAPAAP